MKYIKYLILAFILTSCSPKLYYSSNWDGHFRTDVAFTTLEEKVKQDSIYQEQGKQWAHDWSMSGKHTNYYYIPTAFPRYYHYHIY